MLKVSNLSLGKLLELKSAVNEVSNSIAEKLTDYALISKDAYFNDIPNSLKGEYEKRIKYNRLLEKINEAIEGKVNEYLKED